MATQLLQVISPPRVVAPRGALWAADAALWLIRLVVRLRKTGGSR